MDNKQLGILRRLIFPLVVVLLFFVALPASARELDERIKALEEAQGRNAEIQRANEEELARLKGEQMELRKQATEAAEALPRFIYRPRRGLTIQAADRSWDLSTRFRWHWRVMFFDNKAREEEGFSQGDIALRRWRVKFLPNWANGFYGLDMEFNGGADRDIELQKGELHVRFSKLNPYLPDYIMGLRVSGFFNRHDTNWGSSTGGLFDRSMFQDGAGIGAGSQNNGAALQWSNVPLGPGRIRVLQFIYSNQGLVNVTSRERPSTDHRALHVGFNIEPFSKLKKVKWLRGIDIGIGYQLDQADTGLGNSAFRVRTTERQRLQLIRLDRGIKEQRHYIAPGFGWKVGPYWLRTAFGYNRGTQENDRGVEGWMWRIAHELFLWSPKGFLTGSTSTAGSVMFFTGFERDNYRAADNGLRDCSSTGSGNCEGAYAYNANAGFWYFIRPGLRVGVEYSFYHVNKIQAQGADELKGVNAGEDVDFNSVDLGITFDF